VKKVYRSEDNRSYWNRRWTEANEDANEFIDLNIYPVSYANQVISRVPGKIIEIGCGLGRLVKHYHSRGREIVGIERSEVAVEKILANSPHLDVRYGDATALGFDAEEFDIALAFGVYHNFETGLDKGLSEVARILKPGGHFVISMRPDNIEMILNEWYWIWKNGRTNNTGRVFHKLLVKEGEFKELLARNGLVTTSVHRARNLSILYRLPFLQSRDIKGAPESLRRAKGYNLNTFGIFADRILTKAFPASFCNVLVFEGRKIVP
jgi:SAM-dependent methyltransferase